jgi:hypothetical protein
MIICKNCAFDFEGKFCPNCSQKADTHRFTIGHFVHDFFHALTHTDKGMLYLIREMFTRPGQVALEYNAGKRKKYFNPITFLLIMTAVQVFVIAKTNFFDAVTSSSQTYFRKMISTEKSDLERFDRQMEESNKQVSKVTETKLTTFLLTPLLAMFTWLFFRKSGHNLAENLIFNVLVLAQLTVYFIPVAIIPFLIMPSYVVLWFTLYFLLNIVYSFIAYKQFFKLSWAKTIFKGIAVQIIYMVVAQMLTNIALKII